MADKRVKKQHKVASGRHKTILKKIASGLKAYDLSEWKRACTSFAPIKYSEHTRKQWLRENKFRLGSAREIVEFVESWVENLRRKRTFGKYTVTALREFVIGIVRQAQEAQGIEIGRLNVVKHAGFKTLVKWADNRGELEEGPYHGAEKKSPEMVYEPRSR